MYFVANWKMFGDLRSLNSLDKVIKFSKNNKKNKLKIVYCPPNTLIRPLSRRLKKTKIEVGAQNCHHSYDYGAHTGQVNSTMLKNVGAKYVILGHSENRQLGEKDNLINLKIKSAINAKLKVILCIGETLKEKRSGKTKSVLSKQIKYGLDKIKIKTNLFIAYEPVWSIGTGKILNPLELNQIVKFIKNKFKKKSPQILYGGSVNTSNIKNLKNTEGLNGFLIGGASQNAKNFIDRVKKTYN